MDTFAIVVGNRNYSEGTILPNAINDAKAVYESFQKLGFESELFLDCKSTDCSKIVESFTNKMESYDAGIFYYAGHGFEVSGQNALPAIDSSINKENSIAYYRRSGIMLDEILDVCRQYPNKVHIIILDACRYPTSERGDSKESFAPINAPQGTLVAFSTSPSKGAKDNLKGGDHSPYAKAFLQYLDVTGLTVEDLFKKVRQSVFAWTEGEQVPWEHTSLINDFYFNSGQKVFSLQLPYSEEAIKDAYYQDDSEFGSLIKDMRHYDWYVQNPTVAKLISIPPTSLNKNRMFILGRNLYQTSDLVFNSKDFFNNLGDNLDKYSVEGENHVLNGILFEIYYDSHGQFRNGKFKLNRIQDVLALRRESRYKKSFDFISELLLEHKDYPIFIPNQEDKIIDVIITANNEKVSSPFGGDTNVFQSISSIMALGVDITEKISKKSNRQNASELTKNIADCLCAPERLINIHSNINLIDIRFPDLIIPIEW